uniref:GDP-Man:Man(3)GlcNAc(2)-PP-Dol alpha-1,2-mannosyltransferase n=1 Tax=Phaeomonas parva TaxID=124430 RepID=A0A7S1XN84_9STRA|mmetsp:Transcript_23855/g.75090  ORF Transcript_23855/g.75090 Transcript_23855/m.75090 type:complete len:566 (+) Transcript_23855:104-1801(+)
MALPPRLAAPLLQLSLMATMLLRAAAGAGGDGDADAGASWSRGWLKPILFVLLGFTAVFRTARAYVNIARNRRRQKALGEGRREPLEVCFFHPYASGGGGGERVLWLAVKALLTEVDIVDRRDVCVTVYHGDAGADEAALLRSAQERFGIRLPAERFTATTLRLRRLVDPKNYPVFTMLFQALGSAILALEACLRRPPDVFVDTTGFAFAYPLVALLFCPHIAAYVHYPTIQREMLARVVEGRPAYNNGRRIASSTTLSGMKLLYYRLLGAAYGFCGSFAVRCMANSSWTKAHIEDMWGAWGSKVMLLYPPVNTRDLSGFALNPREPVVLSVGQFRPEKDHELQIRAFATLRRRLTAAASSPSGGDTTLRRKTRDPKPRPAPMPTPRLVLVGGVRNEGDEALVNHLRGVCAELGLNVGEDVEFRVNEEYDELLRWLSTAAVGIHTMWNEHFGIGVVEMQAAGCVTVAHDSGGPRSDIVQPFGDGSEDNGEATGFLADGEEAYADALARALQVANPHCDPSWLAKMDALRERARAAAEEYSDDAFAEQWVELIAPLLLIFEASGGH